MTCEIICVGTELLLGDIVNTNAAYLSAKLAELGVNVYNQTVIGDNPARLTKSIESAIKHCDMVILTGGLGPTADDITKETAAKVCGLRLIQSEEIYKEIEDYYARQSRQIPDGVPKQALVPEGATIFKNEHGTAPGLMLSKGDCKLILLPGPPKEMQPMFEQSVAPFIKKLSKNTIISKSLFVYGLGESEVANKIGQDILNGENPTVATYAKNGEVQVRITASGKDESATAGALNKTAAKVMEILGDTVYSTDEIGLQNTAVKLLLNHNLKVSTAESCTAGMLSKAITEVSGSSRVFELGISAYANDIKIKTLNVPKEIIALHGAVSAETAALMAKGVRATAAADLGIGITGVAGPEQSEGKPVGLVYISLTDGSYVWIRMLNAAFLGDRERVRNAATLAALDLIRRYCLSLPQKLGGGTAVGEALMPQTDINAFAIPATAQLNKIDTFYTESIDSEDITKPLAEELSESSFILETLEENQQTANKEEYTVTPTPESTHQEPHALSADTKTAEAKKQPRIIGFLKAILPWKDDPIKEIVRKSIFLIALITFIAAGIYLVNYYMQGSINEGMAEEARAIYSTGGDRLNSQGMLTRFEDLYKQNSDISGWLKIDGTKIDYPVYQTEDNDFYVTHDMSGQPSRYGAIFADYTAKLENDNRSKNIVLYGHNMIDRSMFGGIVDYTKLSFYKDNPLINFDTLYDTGTYKVFAVIITNVKEEHDNGYIFNYMQNSFSSESNFLNWMENVKVRSIINTDVDVIGTDEVLTLSTCSYEFDDARTVVFARRVREGESLYVNTEAAKLNPTPVYPQAYYDKYGGEKPEIEINYHSETSSETTSDTASTASGTKIPVGNEHGTVSGTDLNNDQTVNKITVSNYVGLSLKEAIAKINSQGLYISSIEYTGEDINKNDILAQSVKDGEIVPEGSGIVLTVSGSPVKITMPDFVGMSLKEAEEKATEVGLTLSTLVIASTEKKNTVTSQSVEPDTVVEDRSLIIYVSNGRNQVPDVVGMKTAAAKKELKKAGFKKVKVVKIETTDKTQIGVVCSQSVSPTTYYLTTDTIKLYVGKKPQKTESKTSSTTSKKAESTKNESSKAESSKAASSTASKKEETESASSKVTTSSAPADTSSNTSTETASSSTVTE